MSRRCRKSFGKYRCQLVRDHENGWGHAFQTEHGLAFLDDPMPPKTSPNWLTTPYPIHRPWWRR